MRLPVNLEREIWRKIHELGPLAAEVQARLQTAEAGQLEAWVEAILDARSVEEVFAR